VEKPSHGWVSLYRTGAALFLVTGVSTVVFGVLENFYEFAGFCNNGCNFQDVVTYVGNNANLFYATDIFLMLAVLVAVPALLALFVALKDTNVGLSALGASFAIVGCGIILTYIPDAFYLVQEARILVTGTGATYLTLDPLNATAGLGIASTGNNVGFLVILLGVLVLGVVMLMSVAFGKIAGVLAILAALVGIVGTSIYPTGGGTNAEIVSMLTYSLILLWNIVTAWKLVKIPG